MSVPENLEVEIKKCLTAIKKGDRSSFKTLVDKLGPRMFAFLKGILQSDEDAGDALQETFMTILNKSDQFNPGLSSSATAWIYAVTRNQALQMLRKRRPTPQDTDTKHPGTPESVLIDKESLESIDRAVSCLPIDLRIPFLMREYLDLSYSQIAHLTDKNVNQTASELFRARTILQNLLRAKA